MAQGLNEPANIAHQSADILPRINGRLIGHTKAPHIHGRDVEAALCKRRYDVLIIEPPAKSAVDEHHEWLRAIARRGDVQADAAGVDELMRIRSIQLHR